jgi:hypothetical protein
MRWRLALPLVYLAFAAWIWFDFARTNPDGLANIGLMFAVLPITVLGLVLGWAVGESSFVLLPDGFGYYGNHALFYVPSVLLIAVALWYLGRRIDRRRR